jgi:hypothetical protein
MHASIPVSVHEVPPGFENVSAKRAKLDTSAALSMATQIPWRCPEKVWRILLRILLDDLFDR